MAQWRSVCPASAGGPGPVPDPGGSPVPQLLSPAPQQGIQQGEQPGPPTRGSPALPTVEKSPRNSRDPAQPETIDKVKSDVSKCLKSRQFSCSLPHMSVTICSRRVFPKVCSMERYPQVLHRTEGLWRQINLGNTADRVPQMDVLTCRVLEDASCLNLRALGPRAHGPQSADNL